MLERPAISDDEICACIEDAYGIPVSDVAFLPIGYDATASVFRLTGPSGQDYFLKAKSVPVAPASLAVPHFLHQSGIDEIVAPLPSRSGALAVPFAGAFHAILYPFVEGRVGAQGGLSPAQWTQLGGVMGRVHADAPPPELRGQMRVEPFVPLKGERAWRLHREVVTAPPDDPISQALAVFWRGRAAEIEAILRRAEELGRLAQARNAPLVLCHADIHIHNVLVTPDGGLRVVDWDETILAPKERDLMFVVDGVAGGGGVRREEEEAFLRGYGPTEADPTILAFYRYEWVVQEIAEFGEQVFSRAEGELTRQDGLRHFRALFAPGDVVSGAYAADRAPADR